MKKWHIHVTKKRRPKSKHDATAHGGAGNRVDGHPTGIVRVESAGETGAASAGDIHIGDVQTILRGSASGGAGNHTKEAWGSHKRQVGRIGNLFGAFVGGIGYSF